MYKYIVLCLCVSLSGVLCDLDKKAGDACEWDGVQGKCVKETQCFTTLDKRGDPHPVCSNSSGTAIVCCTDCELVNDTRNVVFSPKIGYYWKDGSKARDNCLQYLDTLPYECRSGGFYSGVSRDYDKEKKCHKIGLWAVGGAPSPGYEPGTEYPHDALLGYGEDLESVQWQAGGSIISDKYILTANNVDSSRNRVKFVALGVKKLSDGPTAWQVHTVKRFIPHPDFKSPSKYNDIGLIETENTITFNKNVLPACLHVEQDDDETAIITTRLDLKLKDFKSPQDFSDTILTLKLDKFSEDECKTVHQPSRNLKDGINSETQMCYGSKSVSPDACMVLSGAPLLISEPFSSCIYSIIGVISFGKSCVGNPDVYTRVAPYKPWIESVVWP